MKNKLLILLFLSISAIRCMNSYTTNEQATEREKQIAIDQLNTSMQNANTPLECKNVLILNAQTCLEHKIMYAKKDDETISIWQLYQTLNKGNQQSYLDWQWKKHQDDTLRSTAYVEVGNSELVDTNVSSSWIFWHRHQNRYQRKVTFSHDNDIFSTSEGLNISNLILHDYDTYSKPTYVLNKARTTGALCIGLLGVLFYYYLKR